MILARLRGIHPPDNIQNGGRPGGMLSNPHWLGPWRQHFDGLAAVTRVDPVNSKGTGTITWRPSLKPLMTYGRHVRMEWKIRLQKEVCFRPLNSCILTRKKAKNFQQYLKFNTKHVSRA